MTKIQNGPKFWTAEEDNSLLYAWATHTLSIESLANKFGVTKFDIIQRLVYLGGCDNE